MPEPAPLLAQHFCREKNVPLAMIFQDQYVLTALPLVLEGFAQVPIGGRMLYTAPSLPVIRLVDGAGALVGVCLGRAVNARGLLLQEDEVIPGRQSASPGLAPDWAALDAFVTGLAGRYVVIAHLEGTTRVYGDPTTSQPCFYDRLTGTVASSLLMCLNRPIEENQIQSYEEAVHKRKRFCFGTTRDVHVRLLTANHWFDPDTLETRRFWPRAGDMEEVTQAQVPQLLDRIAARLSEVFGAIVSNTPSIMPISGGWDSRTLIAAGKPHLHHVQQFFTHAPNRIGRIEARVARMIAARLGVAHETHSPSQLTPLPERAIRRRLLYAQAQSGYFSPVSREQASGLQNLPIRDTTLLRGNVMDLLRGSQWKIATRENHSDRQGLLRCGFVASAWFDDAFVEQWLPHYQAWDAGLPADARRSVYDMIFVEQHMPYAGLLTLTFTNNFYLNPFNDRQLIADTIKLPLDYRRTARSYHDLIARTAPELADIPMARDLMRR